MPYGVKVQYYENETFLVDGEVEYIHDDYVKIKNKDKEIYIMGVKPYLRPMSSMTDEEKDKLFDILEIDKNGKDEDWIKINDVLGIKLFFPTGKWIEHVALAYDYLYSIHLDFRGLIPIGLALEAPEGMYNIE